MKNKIPPVERSQRLGLLDETLFKISNRIFSVPLFGYGISGVVNILFLYLCYKRVTCFSICCFLILYYLVVRIVQTKILCL